MTRVKKELQWPTRVNIIDATTNYSYSDRGGAELIEGFRALF
jgi:hypothetical protein